MVLGFTTQSVPKVSRVWFPPNVTCIDYSRNWCMVKGGYGGPFLLDLSPIQFSVKKYDLPTTQVTMYQMPYKTPSPTQPQPTIQFLPGLTLSIVEHHSNNCCSQF
jgi:hypothetical protein